MQSKTLHGEFTTTPCPYRGYIFECLGTQPTVIWKVLGLNLGPSANTVRCVHIGGHGITITQKQLSRFHSSLIWYKHKVFHYIRMLLYPFSIFFLKIHRWNKISKLINYRDHYLPVENTRNLFSILSNKLSVILFLQRVCTSYEFVVFFFVFF